MPFTASFVAGSDLEFSVHPQMGELPAASESNPGTLITVAFKPTMYGKNYNAKLLIQVKVQVNSGVIRVNSDVIQV